MHNLPATETKVVTVDPKPKTESAEPSSLDAEPHAAAPW